MLNKICVIGLGYVGLPSAVILADKGMQVIGCEINPETVSKINQGIAPNKEVDLDEMLAKAVRQGKLHAQTTPAKADVFILAVPTPTFADKSPDMSYVVSAVTALAPYLEKNNLIILESTSPVGSTRMLANHLVNLRPDLDFTSDNPDVLLAYCPERILPGNILSELVNNSRSIGGLTPRAAQLARDVYSIFCKGQLSTTSAEVAEFSKLVENSFRDVNIAFANELSYICDQHKVNVNEVIALANKHPRVNILSAGIGVGGHCIPVDPWFLVHGNPDEAKLIKQARLVNDFKPLYVANKIIEKASDLNVSNIGVLGLTYKPNVDDFRESPAFALIKQLTAQSGLNVFVHDPFMSCYSGTFSEKIHVEFSSQELIEKTDILLIATPHVHYLECDFERHIQNNTLFDPSDFILQCQESKAALDHAIHHEISAQAENI